MFSPVITQLAAADRDARLAAQAEADRLAKAAAHLGRTDPTNRSRLSLLRDRRRARRPQTLTTAPANC